MATRKKTRGRKGELRIIDLRPKRRPGNGRADFDIGAALQALASKVPAAPQSDAPLAPSAPSRALRVVLEPGETQEGMRAKTTLRPTVRAAKTVAAFDASFEELDLTTLAEKLAQQVTAVQGGDLSRAEEMLVAQAHTLDMLFHQLVHRSMANSQHGYLDASETYMRLALRTQSQCRATLETLSVVKNPPAVAFVRQANIANGPQQVNNGTTPAEPPSRAREIPQPQLLEQQRGERLDTGTAQATGRGDPAMAPLGEINGAALRGG